MSIGNLYVMNTTKLTMGLAGKFGLCVLLSPNIYGSKGVNDENL